MSGEEYTYEFDPSGVSPDNKVVGEQHVLSPPDWTDHYFIIPKFAPFFREGLKVVHQNTGEELIEGEDYQLTHRFKDATVGTAKQVFGSITLLRKTTTGAATLQYQSLGGIWTLSEQKIIDILSNTKLDPRITTWEQVAGMPVAFPPVDHDWHVDDLIGMSEVVDATSAIADAISGGASAGESHISRTDNPHQVTKVQVGLSLVNNWPNSTQLEAEEMVRNDRYMTPLRVKQAIDASGASAAGAHIDSTSNPHQVTKTQVGLSQVENYPMADGSEAVQGAAENRYMSPKTTRDAIDQRVGNTLGEHVSSTDNPHSVTKTQVGLGSVQNYGIATQNEAEQGTSNLKYMTPLRTKQLVDASVGEGLSGHANLTDNPHQVTKAQVGLGNVQNYGSADEPTAREGTSGTTYLTVQAGSWLVDEQAVKPLNAHVNNTSNPHNVTKAQVGLSNVPNHPMASTAEAQAGSRNDRFMSPLRTFELISQYSTDPLNNHVGDTSNPHQVTAAQTGAYDVSQTDALLAGKLDSGATAANSAGLEGRSFSEVMAEILVNATKADVGLGNVDNTSDANKPVSDPQQSALALKLNVSDVLDVLTSTNTTAALSANQGRVLKGLIDNINTLLASDNATLDTLQEVVDYIETNRETLDTLSVSNITGLQAALDGKVDKVAGKGLSTEDYTTAEKTALANLQTQFDTMVADMTSSFNTAAANL